MWLWRWRSFWWMQTATFVALVFAFAGITLFAFYTAALSAGGTGAPPQGSEFQQVTEWFATHPLEPKAAPRGNIPITNLLAAVVVDIGFWALVASVTWSAAFTSLFGFFHRGTRKPRNPPMQETARESCNRASSPAGD